jgi:hypothetical protein
MEAVALEALVAEAEEQQLKLNWGRVAGKSPAVRMTPQMQYSQRAFEDSALDTRCHAFLVAMTEDRNRPKRYHIAQPFPGRTKA